MSTTEVKIRIGLEGADQVQAGAVKATQAVKNMGGGVSQMGKSAGLANFQTQQLSAQLQDFFIQIQAGGSPITAFTQQFSQLTTVYGGAGNAIKAVGALITPTTVALGAAVGVVGGLAYAFKNGSDEQLAFSRALVLTGNAAGVTTSQLQQMAKAQSGIAGRSGAADVLASLAATGKLAGQSLDLATEATLRLQRDGGVAIKTTVQAFKELGEKPLDALKKLNDEQHFLTLSQYKQVQALQERGRADAAASLAQDIFAKASIERTKDLEKSLGTLESAWRAVGVMAKTAWEKMLDIGRPDGTLQKIDGFRKELDTILKSAGGKEPVAGSYSANRVKLIRERIQLLAEQAKAESSVADASRKSAVAASEGITAAEAAAKARKSAAEEAERLVKAGEELVRQQAFEIAGLSGDYLQKMKELAAARKAGKISAEQQAIAQQRLIEQQPFMKKAAEDQAKAVEDARKAHADYIKSLDRSIVSNDKETESLQDQYIELTAGKVALQEMRAAREENLALMADERMMSASSTEEYVRLRRIADQLREQIALRRGIAAATADKAVNEANAKAAADAQREWERASDQIGQSLADALMQGGKSAADYIKSLFRTMVLRPIIQGVVQPYANALSGFLGYGTAGTAGANGATGQAMQYVQGAQALNSLYGYGQGAYNWAAGTGVFGSSAAASVSPAAAQAAYGGAAGEIMGGGTAASGTAAAGGSSMAAYAGWAALAAVIYSKGMADYEAGFRRDQARETGTIAGRVTADTSDLLSKLGVSDKWADFFGATAVAALIGHAAPRVTGSGIQGSLGGGKFTGTGYADIYEKGGLFRSDKTYQSLSALPDDLARFMDDAANGVLDKAKEFGDALGLPVTALESVTTTLKLNLGDTLGNNEQDIKDALAAYGDALVSGWQDALKPVAIYGESTIQTIERVGAAIKGTNDVLGLLDIGMLESSVAGGQAAAALAAAFGSLDNLTQASAAYYQNYYSEAERAAKSTEQITAVLQSLGLELPASRDAFRSLVTGLDLATEAGRNQFLVLMQVQGAFASLNPVMDATTAAARSAVDILKERQDLELQLLKLQGDTVAIRGLERDAIDASNQALYDQIKALEDSQSAAQAATTAAAAAAQEAAAAAADAQARVAAVASERAGLQRQLWELQGNTTAIRAAEREALDESNRAIYDQIVALQDSKSAWDAVSASSTTAAVDTRSAWSSVWSSITDEVLQLRASIGSPAQNAATTAARFATATAQARAGDVTAAGDLPGLAKTLADQARNSTATRAEFDVVQGKLAASLERTLQATGAPESEFAKLRTDVTVLGDRFEAALAQVAAYSRQGTALWAKFDVIGMPPARTTP